MDDKVNTGQLFEIAADAWGLDILQTRARLRYGSYVSVRYRYLYVDTPKAACTAVKTLLHAIEEFPPLRYSTQFSESKTAMLIHLRDNLALPSIVDLREQRSGRWSPREVLESGDFFRFCVVRDPHSRLLASWYNKVWLGEPGYIELRNRLLADCDRHALYQERKVQHFQAFVRYICATHKSARLDPHWRPQTLLLFPNAIRYALIARFETLARDLDPFAEWLRRHGCSQPIDLARVNSSPGLTHRDLYYDEPTAQLAHDLYADDFECFGYDAASWRRMQRNSGHLDESAAAWEKEIIERNEFLAQMFTFYRGK